MPSGLNPKPGPLDPVFYFLPISFIFENIGGISKKYNKILVLTDLAGQYSGGEWVKR
jgi:hypothetical protein